MIVPRVDFLLALGAGVEMVQAALGELVLVGDHDPVMMVRALFRGHGQVG